MKGGENSGGKKIFKKQDPFGEGRELKRKKKETPGALKN